MRGRGMASFANHSDRPNAELLRDGNDVLLYTTQVIEEGDEVTISYGPPESQGYKVAMGLGRYVWTMNGSEATRSYREILSWDWNAGGDREMAMKECRGQMESLKALASDSHLKLVDPSVSGCPIEPAVGCHPVLPFHEFVGLSQGDSFDCFYRALAIGMVVHQGPEFTRWTSHWQQAEIDELFDGRKATNIVASIKKEMVKVLDRRDVHTPGVTPKLDKIYVATEEGFTMFKALFIQASNEVCGSTRHSNGGKGCKAPETIEEMKQSVMHGKHGSGDAIVLLAGLVFDTRFLIVRARTSVGRLRIEQHDTPTYYGRNRPCIYMACSYKAGAAAQQVGHWMSFVGDEPSSVPNTSKGGDGPSSVASTSGARSAKRAAKDALCKWKAHLGIVRGNLQAPPHGVNKSPPRRRDAARC